MSEHDQGVFGFETLDVYRVAVEFLAVPAPIIQGLPTVQHPLADQLISFADGQRHYAIARGSAMECAAILDAC